MSAEDFPVDVNCLLRVSSTKVANDGPLHLQGGGLRIAYSMVLICFSEHEMVLISNCQYQGHARFFS